VTRLCVSTLRQALTISAHSGARVHLSLDRDKQA
jgi:hypothetical protein